MDRARPRVGVLVGMASEAGCLEDRDDLVVRISGSQPAKAKSLSQDLIGEGVEGLVSFGLAGALDLRFDPGDLVLAESVIDPARRRFAVDAAWRTRFDQATNDDFVCVGGLVAGTDRVLGTAEEKAALARETGAIAVDMESHWVAWAADNAGLPFLVVRAIVDRADQAVPDVASAGIDADGRPRIWSVVGGLIRRPSAIGDVFRLARGSAVGLESLERIAPLIVDCLIGHEGEATS